jgi:glycosyltransferase involved in cell wall biosynthesis
MNINIQSPYNSLGYGIASKNILRELDLLGNNISYFPIGNPQPEKQEEVPLLQKTIANQDSYDKTAPSLKIWHQHDLAQHVGKGKHCAFPFFELNKFTEREKHHLAQQDLLFASSSWAKTILERNVPGVPVEIAHLGVDRTIFYDTIVEAETDKPTVFLNVGKWEIRKGHDILVDIFNAAFSRDDNVQLVLSPENPFLKPEQTAEWVKLYRNSKLTDKISILPRFPTQEDLANLMRMCDVGIFPARAEGWNLEALEMMSCGKLVISTNYSAHSDFMNDGNSMLVQIDELEDAYDGIWFHGQGQWASFDENQFDQFVSYMQSAHATIQDGKRHFEKAVETANYFSWTNTAKQIEKGIS